MIITQKIPVTYANKSNQANELPRIAFAIPESCKPSLLITFKCCVNSTQKEKQNTIIAVVQTDKFRKDFKKQ
jgi:hypothetical protein